MYQGKEYLKSKLNTVSTFVSTRYDFYNKKKRRNADTKTKGGPKVLIELYRRKADFPFRTEIPDYHYIRNNQADHGGVNRIYFSNPG